MKFTSKQIVLRSQFLILITNLIVAIVAGKIIGRWAFVPMMLIGWAIAPTF